MFLRLKPSLTAQDAKHMKFWRFKACAMHLRVPVSSMMEVLSISRSIAIVYIARHCIRFPPALQRGASLYV
jgi:hypothetical protein